MPVFCRALILRLLASTKGPGALLLRWGPNALPSALGPHLQLAWPLNCSPPVLSDSAFGKDCLGHLLTEEIAIGYQDLQ